MNFLRSIFKKIDHSFSIKRSRISFHSEQTGESEDEIKKLWRESLKKFVTIKEAYLVLTKFRSNDVPHPTLCLFPSCKDKKAIVLKLSEDFKQVFNSDQFIDIIFLTPQMHYDCKSVCHTFYIKIDQQ